MINPRRFAPLTRTRLAGYPTAMLLFKKKFLAAIRSGRKTQTIRLWKHQRMRSGQRSYIPGVKCSGGAFRAHLGEVLPEVLPLVASRWARHKVLAVL